MRLISTLIPPNRRIKSIYGSLPVAIQREQRDACSVTPSLFVHAIRIIALLTALAGYANSRPDGVVFANAAKLEDDTFQMALPIGLLYLFKSFMLQV